MSPPPNPENRPLFLITGGHGFLGSHLARRLYELDCCDIRIVDLAPKAAISGPLSHEFLLGNLCDSVVSRKAVRGVHTVFHFAATMGGMGTIHSANDSIIYKENHIMTLNILEASINANVKRFFYASSACVYPTDLQNDTSSDVSLRESDSWRNPPPSPQGLYGLEKLNSELLMHQFNNKIDIRIARFHNVYGPGGSWRGGREKAPAALLRKAIALKLVGSNGTLEVWGDGNQRRSFLWVGDAVNAVFKLMDSDYHSPINVGSDVSTSMHDLANLALQYANLAPSRVALAFDGGKPVGVASRNSNNDTIRTVLNWEPTMPLQDGIYRLGTWIEKEMKNEIASARSDRRDALLQQFMESKVLNLSTEAITYGILLPITSKGTTAPGRCLTNLKAFSQSLLRTTWRDVHGLGGRKFSFTIYLAIDADDTFLLGVDSNKAQHLLEQEGILEVKTLVRDYPPGSICRLWCDCAKAAWEDRCDYMVLMGEDIILGDEGWMRDAHEEFLQISIAERVPFGFGCVAFTDTSFPGMPTFPIIHKTHMNIFHGQVIPDIFINQDGDPFLFQLYRRWGCSRMFSSRLSNGIGGEMAARYTKKHVSDWTFETLDDATSTLKDWLHQSGVNVEPKLTVDIVVPCYRVNISILEQILSLKPSESCNTMFIIIIDNPFSPHIAELNAKYADRPDVRIRVNKENLGASASRNKGMQESSAEWIHFLDDDVVPEPSLLVEDEKIIRNHPQAAGFVGNTLFPIANTIFTTATHLSGVTFFWDIARRIDNDVPWGVTANLIARRNVRDGVTYDTSYPKTGGGEDIDFCRQKRAFAMMNGGEGFVAAPKVIVSHPWWNNGARSYWRFYRWSVGDGALIRRYPADSYRDYAPNAAELCTGFLGLGLLAVCFGFWSYVAFCIKALISTIIANITHDLYRHLLRHPERNEGLNVSNRIKANLPLWSIAVVESSLIRIFSELGRLRGILSRWEFDSIGMRFDWFCGRWEGPIGEERANNVQRFVLSGLILAVWCHPGMY